MSAAWREGFAYGTMQNCYSAAAVKGTGYNVGGVAGFVQFIGTNAAQAKMQNCAALNPGVSGMEFVGRVAGDNDNATLSGNYAFSVMTVIADGSAKSPLDEGAAGIDGADMGANDALTAAFWTGTMGWPGGGSPWTFTDGYLPGLSAAVKVDSGWYLTPRTLALADVTLGQTGYTYTGSAIAPAVTIVFGDYTLVQGTDYTCAVTGTDNGSTISAGVNAGTATFTLTGKGNYTGTYTGTFTITPAAQAAPEAPTAAQVLADGVLLAHTDLNVMFRQGATGVGQSSLQFTGLTPNTEYYFYAYYPADRNHTESPNSAALSITTDYATFLGTPAIDNTSPQYLDTLTADLTGLSADPGGKETMGELSYLWRRDGEQIVGATNSTYTVQSADIGKKISVTVMAENCQGSVNSAATSAVVKRTPVLADLSYTITAATYNGGAQPIGATSQATGIGVITVKYDGSATAPVNAKTSYAVTAEIAEGTNYASASLSLGSYTIQAKTITAGMIDAIGEQTYSGSAIKPEPTISDGTATLIKGTDFDYSYSNNTNAGTNAKVTVTGKGNYSGTADKTFTIKGLDIPPSNITVTSHDAAYDGSAHGISVTDSGSGAVTYSAAASGTYAVNSPTFTDVGEYTVYFKVNRPGGNYNEYSGTGTVTIRKANQTTPTITGGNVTKKYGEALTISVTGGESTGAYSYSSSDEAVATINASGVVTILKVGVTTLSVKKLGDGNYNESATASITLTVIKADQSAPSAPVSSAKTDTAVTLTAISGAKYAKNTTNSAPAIPGTGQWQDSNVFTGLSANTTYYFFACYPETATHNASAASAGLSVTTDFTKAATPAQPAAGSVTAAGFKITNTYETSTYGKMEYHIKSSGAYGAWTEYNETNGITGLDPDTTYTVQVRYAGNSTTYSAGDASPETTVTTPKAALSGSVTITGTAKFGQTLTADLTALTTTPGGADKGALTYQWKRGSTNIGTNSASYTLAQADIGQNITVTVTAANCTGSIDASTGGTIGKADGPAAPAPVTGSYTGNGTTFTYTVTAITGAEYNMDGGSWQDSNVFSGITPATNHTFYARMKTTATHEAGAAGDTGLVSFVKLTGPAAPALNFTVSGDFPSKTISVIAVTGAEYSFDGGLNWGDTNTANSAAEESKTLAIRMKTTATHEAGTAATETINTAYQNQNAPAVFTLIYENINDASYTVTIPTTPDAEYSFDGTNWDDSAGANVKIGCQPGDIVTGYKRMAAKTDYNASGTVSNSMTLPLFQVKTPVASPNGGSFTGTQSVTLSCATAGASIHYTTDGTTPTAGSTRYTGAFTLSASAMVKAIAVMSGMSASAVLTAAFTKRSENTGDTTTPTTPSNTVDIDVNGQTVKATLSPDGTLTLIYTESDIQKYADGSGEFNITVSGQDSVGVDVNIAALGGDGLAIHTNFGTITIPNETLRELQALYGDTLRLVLVKGSFKVTLLDNNKKEVAYSDPAHPFVLKLPYELANGQKPGAVVAVDTSGNILPFGVYADGSVTLKIGATGTYDVMYNEKTFSDIAGHWAADNIGFGAARALYSGIGDGLFDPNGSMTRAMFAQLLANLEDVDLSVFKTSRFGDVAVEQWYAAAVEWAADSGIVSGYDGRFDPNAGITREQMAVMLYNYMRYKGYAIPSGTASAFADEDSISSWAYEAVKAVQKMGIAVGKPGNLYDPQATATRAEVATIFANFIKYVAGVTATEPQTAAGNAMAANTILAVLPGKENEFELTDNGDTK